MHLVACVLRLHGCVFYGQRDEVSFGAEGIDVFSSGGVICLVVWFFGIGCLDDVIGVFGGICCISRVHELFWCCSVRCFLVEGEVVSGVRGVVVVWV